MSLSSAVHEALTADDDGRVCRDIPEEACRHQPANFVKHVASLAATKTGDGLLDPKLVLSWLLGALGASPAWIGWLVPVREAGALLPQLVISGAIRARPVRKWVWSAGSCVQGLAALGMAWAALALEGASAGAAVVGLLAVFALARSACSVSYKDVLGKTVSKSTRGTATGTASTIAAAAVLAYGVLLSAGVLDRSVTVIATGLAVAGLLWMIAAATFATLAEEPGAVDGGGRPLDVARGQLSLLREDSQLRRFIWVRGLLLATALAPPYLLALAGAFPARVPHQRFALPALMFVLMVAYQGVRLGRSTHVVDMADAERRAAYTALSNTAVGLLLVAGGAAGAVAARAGESVVLAGFAVLCALAGMLALTLEEVQRE